MEDVEIRWRLTLVTWPKHRRGHYWRVAVLLVVEDERDIRELLRRYLERENHTVLTAANGATGIRTLEEAAPDLLLLDLGLPDIDGLEVLERARQLHVATIALTARSAVEDRIKGLQAGADDYVGKPFSPQEVVLRVAAVLNRGSLTTRKPESSTFAKGRIRIDFDAHQAFLDDALLDLTPTEWELLTILSGRPNKAFTRAELVNRLRGYEFSAYERTIDSHIKNLRRKLCSVEIGCIETVQGVGYRFGVAADA